MRKIKLVNYLQPSNGSSFANNKYYSVSLGNGLFLQYKSERLLLKALALINESLNNTLVNLNAVAIQVYNEYRFNLVYIDSATCEKINRCFAAFDKSINFAMDRCHLSNGNHFVFSHLRQAIENLTEVITKVELAASKLNHYATINRAKAIKQLLAAQVEDLHNVGLQTGAAFVNRS